MIHITVDEKGQVALVREDDDELQEGIDYDVFYEGEPVEGVDMDARAGTMHHETL